MESFIDTYTKEVAIANAGTYLGGVGTSLTFLIGLDLADEIIEVILSLGLAVAPEKLQMEVSSGLDAISKDAVALAAAQAALAVPAPVALEDRTQDVVSAATVTPSADADDRVHITALGEACQLLNPTPVLTRYDGQELRVRILDDGTGRALTYDTQYRALGTALPAVTVAAKTLYLTFVFNEADTTWDLIHAAQEA